MNKLITIIHLNKTIILFLLLVVASNCYSNQYPIIIPHHAGGGEYPENTLYAIKRDIDDGFSYINITLELSKDKIPILFYGFDLAKTTNGNGNPENFTVAELKKLDAGYNFKKLGLVGYPFRDKGITIPTFSEVLEIIPDNTILIVDIKTNKYKSLIDSLCKTLTAIQLKQIIFYSTNADIIKYLKEKIPNAKVFQNRDTTRLMLLNAYTHHKLQKNFLISRDIQWIAFENERNMQVCESFTLGKGCNNVSFKNLWNKKLLDDIKKINNNINAVMIAVNTPKEYIYAQDIGMFGVYTDHPRLLKSSTVTKT
ncbi:MULTISPECIES: glycerophosphodiester phosphodiesterase family protein [Francisella]|uniref:GP-PDE domain-containing protein n=1 Tax=Francisella opportunistica TaxID=2016517 RepID=A0A345JSJ0_9GAMM|nr:MULTISPECIES: glycerophosphodiester phosphodiesterase family protein [Francisella]APC92056.1 glycerophosphoryl diester phosphodiesterase [Francisella sp. MA067296]AXH30286.1 hypothetical protein CGC43_06690 [Francisella opportunistica]AXH31927.1 hypothetical protein CGC44_06670 [Francisella opportunistica]AXH33573.1 hypothetical protein CGC45_06685 [Francisella opportunistica]